MWIERFLDYLRYERNYSVQTIRSYRNDLTLFRTYVTEQVGSEEFDPKTVDKELVRSWVVDLMDHQMMPRSVNRKLSSLRSFFKFLMIQGVIQIDPMQIIHGPKTNRPLPCFVKEEDLMKVLDEPDEAENFECVRDRLIVEMLFDTGMRQSELCGLRNADIDYDAMLIKVTGKRNKQRLIPFVQQLKDRMLKYVEVRNREVATCSEGFFVRKNGKGITPTLVYKVVHTALETVPALARRSPHVLRHSFATSMLNHGAELNAVKELLGHQSLATTSIYTHTTFEELKKMYHAHPRAKKEGGYYGN